jgi:hypothetical protein
LAQSSAHEAKRVILFIIKTIQYSKEPKRKTRQREERENLFAFDVVCEKNIYFGVTKLY